MTSDPGLRFRVVHALADLAEELAVSEPLLIVFAKLDISSRAQLAAETTRQRPGPLHL